MITPFNYTLKVWLTSICISPLVLQVTDYLTNSANEASTFDQVVFMCCFIIVMSFFISVFTWLLFFVCTYQLLKINIPQNLFKLSVQATGLLLVLVTLFVLDGLIALLDYPFWTFTTCYLFTTAACMQLYDIPQSQIYHQENSTT